MSSKSEIAASYMKLRMAKDNAGVLALCHDDIVFESSKDGTKKGKVEFGAYLDSTEPQGTWQDPVENADGTITIKGSVSFMWIPVSVAAVFHFDSDNRIVKITLGRS